MSAVLQHQPVMLREVIGALEPKDGGVYVDGTFGRGGYSRALLNAANMRVIGIDRDPDAVKAGEQLAAEFKPRFTILHGPFGAMDILLVSAHEKKVDGIALDLGVSSPQFDEAARGFSFAKDGPLDMRMSLSGPTAADMVNTMDEKELADIIYLYGEERHSRRIAKRIVEARQTGAIMRTAELADIIRRSMPRSKDGIDPATRTFQALRIHVNDELGELQRGLAAAESLLKPAGRLAVVSFHSLEDRIVKEFLRRRSATTVSLSRHMPAANDDAPSPTFKLLSRKAIAPTEEEIRANPRARSAKLRIAERTAASPMKESVP